MNRCLHRFYFVPVRKCHHTVSCNRHAVSFCLISGRKCFCSQCSIQIISHDHCHFYISVCISDTRKISFSFFYNQFINSRLFKYDITKMRFHTIFYSDCFRKLYIFCCIWIVFIPSDCKCKRIIRHPVPSGKFLFHFQICCALKCHRSGLIVILNPCNLICNCKI